MSLSAVISSVLYGKSNFCCLCFGEVDENALDINGYVYTDDDHSETVSQVIDTVFTCKLETISAFGIFCKQCKKSLIDFYKFTSMCKENSERLFSAISSLQESFENTIEAADDFNTLFVSLDANDFTSQQFYDNKELQHNIRSKIHKRFFSLLKANKRNNNKSRTNSLAEKTIQDYTNSCQKLDEDSYYYNIPTVSTESMLHDDYTDYTCKVCQKTFDLENELRYHFFLKHYPKRYKCPDCPSKFITEELLLAHEPMHKPGVCSLCGKHFSSRDKLQKHERGHIIKIMCQECGRSYSSKEAFKKHITENICQQKSKKSAQDGIYQCDYCKKRYWVKPYLAKHIKYEHGNATGYKCNFCNKQFYTPSRLETHLVKHTGDKKFVCAICGGRFVTKSSLVYHTRLHTGERPYQCDFCESAFLSASRRLDHMRRYHMPPSLKCELCNMMFKSTGALLKHKKRHMNPKSRLNGGPWFPQLAKIGIESSELSPNVAEEKVQVVYSASHSSDKIS